MQRMFQNMIVFTFRWRRVWLLLVSSCWMAQTVSYKLENLYINLYQKLYPIISCMPGKTVAMIWLPTTICGIGACNWTASFANWLNSSLQNKTFWAASSFCCQCMSGLEAGVPDPRTLILALQRSSWSKYKKCQYYSIKNTSTELGPREVTIKWIIERNIIELPN